MTSPFCREAVRLPGAILSLTLLAGAAGCEREPLPAASGDLAQTDVSALLASGEAYYGRGEFDSAGIRFTQVLELTRQRGDLETEAEALVWLGSVAYNRDSYPAARTLLGQALDLQHRHGITTHLWRTNNVLGLVGYKDGRYYDALDRHGVAADLAAAAADTVSLAKSWNNAALIRTELGDFDEARRLLLQALPVARAGGQRLIEGRVLVNLGMLAVRTGDPESAIRYLDSARAPLAEIGDAAGEMNRLGQLGTAYADIGEPGRAIAYLDTALSEARARDSPQEAASNLEHMASVYRQAGDYPRALRMFEDARVLNQGLNLQDEAAFDLRSTAEIHRELGNDDLARRSTDRALAIHRAVGNRLEVLHDLLLLARLAHQAGDRDSAHRLLASAHRLSDTLDARTPRLAVAITSARLADREGDNPTVLRSLAAVSADLAAGGTDAEWESSWLAGRALARMGALDRATNSLRTSVNAVERVRGEFGSTLLRSRFQAAREDVYRDLVDVLLRRGETEQAFEAADASRGRVLLDHLATLRTNGSATVRELAEEERQLLRRIDTVTVTLDRLGRDRGAGEPGALRAEQDRLTTDLERIRGEYAAALTRAEERSGGHLALVGGVRPSAERVRRALRPGTGLLEYYLFTDRLLVFLVTQDRVTSFATRMNLAALSSRIRVVRELVGRPSGPGGSMAALEALHEALVGPVRKSGALAGLGTLVLVPDAELEYVPFAALRNPETGRYLVEDFALISLPSAASLPVLYDRTPATGAGGVVGFAPFPGDLPASRTETEALARALPGAKTVQGPDASEARLRSALEQASVVHVATHGVLNARNPLFSRVELAPGPSSRFEDDGRLEVHEVNRMDIRASLVFLSGCETGLGLSGTTGFHTGEDYATLTRAFLNAGAANVIATLWRVEDRGAAAFADRFYRELAVALARGGTEHGGLAEALSRAQRGMIRDPAWAAPFYWAGFRLTGTGDQPPANRLGSVRS